MTTESQVPEVRTSVVEGTASLALARPKAINALSVGMMDEISRVLHAWVDDPCVLAVELHGRGDRGFCSGADVRAIRQLVLAEPQEACRFFEAEYAMNRLLADYPKPTTAWLHGISMGGGLGLSLHCGRVVAQPDLQLAMPEVGIGLFPDVGVTWELSQAPGELGAFLVMTGGTIDAASALYAGLVDEVVGGADPEGSQLAADRVWVDECFAGDDAAAILARLEGHADERARAAAEVIRQKSPWSVCVALEALRRAGRMSGVDEVLAQDLVLSRQYVADSDFVEGVRAQLVDKDRNPSWRHAWVGDVPRELVLQMFSG